MWGAVCGGVWRCVAVCGGVWRCVRGVCAVCARCVRGVCALRDRLFVDPSAVCERPCPRRMLAVTRIK